MANDPSLSEDRSVNTRDTRRWEVYQSSVSDDASLRGQDIGIEKWELNLDGIRKARFKYQVE